MKVGQKVILRLTAKHTIPVNDEPAVDHAGVITRLYPGGEWADLLLEKEHAGKTTRITAPISCIVETTPAGEAEISTGE